MTYIVSDHTDHDGGHKARHCSQGVGDSIQHTSMSRGQVSKVDVEPSPIQASRHGHAHRQYGHCHWCMGTVQESNSHQQTSRDYRTWKMLNPVIFSCQTEHPPLRTVFLPQLIIIPSFCYSHCVFVCVCAHVCVCWLSVVLRLQKL